MGYNNVYDSQFDGTPTIDINSSPWNLIETEAPTPLYAPKANQLSGTPLGESRFDVISDRRSVVDPSVINQQRADSQPEWLKGVNAVAGGVISGLATAVQDVSYIADIENGIARLTGAQEIEENWLGQAMKDFKGGLGEAMPIYKQDPNAVWDWGDSGSYWSALKGVIDSAVGFGIPGMAAGKLVGAVLKAARTGALLAKMTEGAADTVTALGAGFLTNYAEGKTMGIEMFDNAMENAKSNYYKTIYDKYTNQFGNSKDPQQIADMANAEYEQGLANGKEEEFKKIAGAEADKFQRNNMVFMLTDAIGLSGLFKAAKGGTRNLINAETMKNYFLGMNTDNFAVQGVKEGLEEIGQNVMQSEAEYQAAEKSGVDTKEPGELYDRVLKFATSDKALLEGAMGFFGGPIQRVLTKGMSGQYGGKYKEDIATQLAKQEDQFTANKDFLATKFNQYQTITQLADAAKNLGQDGMAKALKDNMFATKAADNFASGTTEAFEADLKEIASMTPEQAKAKGYEDDYATKVTSMLKELGQLEKEWNKTTKYVNAPQVFENAQNKKLALLTHKVANEDMLKAKAKVIANTAPYRADINDTSDVAFANGTFSDKAEINNLIISSDEYKEYEELHQKVQKASAVIQKMDEAHAHLTSSETQKSALEGAKAAGELMKQVASLQAQKQKEALLAAKRAAGANKVNAAKPVAPAPKQDEAVSKDDKTVGELGGEVVEDGVTSTTPASAFSKPATETTVKTDWSTLVDNAVSEKELDAITDQATKANEYSPELIDVISKKRDALKPVESNESTLITEEEKTTKIIDIEAKRDEELNKLADQNGMYGNREEIIKSLRDRSNVLSKTINDKYDAELTALEAQPTKTDKVAADILNEADAIINDSDFTKEKDASVDEEGNVIDTIVRKENATVNGTIEDASSYDYFRITDGFNAAGYLSRAYKQIYDVLKKAFRRKDVDDALHSGLLDKSILSNKKFKKGTKLVIKVDNDDTIDVYDSTSKTKETITWGEYVRRNNLSPDSQEWKDKVPMAIYDETGKKIMYLHDVEWIKRENILGDIDKNKENLRKIRQSVLDNKDGLSVEVASKTVGKLIKTANKNKVLLSEGMPDKNLIIAIPKNGSLYISREQSSEVLLDIANEKLQNGVTYAIVPMGDRHIAIPVNNLSLGRRTDVINTLIKVIRAHATQDSTSSIQKEISKATGYDILSKEGLTSFLKMYINDSNITGEFVQGKSNKYIITMENGSIYWGKGGDSKTKLPFINKGTPANVLEDALKKLEAHMMNMYTHISLDHLSNKSSQVVIFDDKGNLTTQSYKDYVKSITESNVIGLNIGTDENPEFTYFIQPVIRLAVDDIVNKPTEGKTIESLSDKKDVSGISSEDEVVGELGEIEVPDKYKDFTLNDDGDDLPLSEQSASNMAESAKNIYVADLGASKQSKIVSYIRGKLIEKLFTSEEPVKTETAIKEIYEEYEKLLSDGRIKQQQATDEGRKDIAEKIQLFLDEVSKVMDNWSTLSKVAKEQVAKINGVTIDLNEDDELTGADVVAKENHDDSKAFTMDGLTRVSVKVKQLFGKVKQIDKNGNVVKNYLNQETTVPFDDVYQAIQSITADSDPDFDILMSKMRAMSDKIKWMPQAIQILDSSPQDVKNSFVKGMTSHTHNMKFIMWSRGNDGKYKLVEYDANSNSLAETTKLYWKNNMMYNSELAVNNIEGELVGNREFIEKHVAEYDALVANGGDLDTLKAWLNTIGIEMTDDALKEFNGKIRGLDYQANLTQPKGVFKIIRNNLSDLIGKSLNESTFFSDSAVKTLTKIQIKYNSTFTSSSFRAGTKTIFSYGNNKMLINQIRRAKEINKSADGNYTNTFLTGLCKTAFNSNGEWLKDMIHVDEHGNPKFASNGEVIIKVNKEGVPTSTMLANLDHAVVSVEAIKEMGAKSKDNRELHKLSPMEIEVFKMGMLQSDRKDASENNKRVIAVTFPTASDKTTVMMLQVKAFEAKYDENTEVSDETLDRLYDIFALPELKRIAIFQSLPNNNRPNDEAYSGKDNKFDGGANKFILFPEFNNIVVNGERIFDEKGKLHGDVENAEFKKEFKRIIKLYIDTLVEEKLGLWDTLGIGKTVKDANGKIVAKNAFIHDNFIKDSLSKSLGILEKDIIKFAATDMVLQYLVSNVEAFKMFIGDPAQFWSPKRDSQTITEQIKDTFENIGKRLASSIAPGTELAGAMGDNYIQIIVKDHKAASQEYNGRLKRVLSKSDHIQYGEVNTSTGEDKRFKATDAQEYTTWREHVKVLQMEGRLTQKQVDTIEKTLGADKELSEELLGAVLQPTKPVFADHIEDNGLRKFIYIKSSSFPLIAQLTKGIQMDKVRIAMEELEKNQSKSVRLAYNTAVKVGGLASSAEIWDENGDVVEGLSFLPVEGKRNSWIELNRKGFRIQQDVPHEAAKESIREVTQTSKNLFTNFLNIDGFKVPWSKDSYTGKKLQDEFNSIHGELYRMGVKEIHSMLLDESGNVDIAKLAAIVKDEAIRRNYNISDRLLIELNQDLKFLPFSAIADKYQAVLNSLVYDRVLKQKIHGKSLVLGSAQGFKNIKTKKEADAFIGSTKGIIFTDNWNGELGVQPTGDNKDGSVKLAQVLLPWKFRDNKGNILNIEDFTKTVDGKTTIDFDKLPKELLEGFGMRIPNQGSNSQVAFEVVGFLPNLSGDLVVATEDLVVQMGSDFDVDKLYTYTYNTFYNNGKLTKITEETKKLVTDLKNLNKESIYSLLFADEDFVTELEDEASTLKKVQKKLNKLILQNKIIDIHMAVHKNPAIEVQAAISTPLGTAFIEGVAKNVAAARGGREKNKMFLGVSESYQTRKFIQATAGKDGVSVFSLDSMFNAVAQGTGIKFMGKKVAGNDVPFRIAFGKASKGKLDKEKTLDGKYFISDVIAGYQSSSVDNEKLQVMDKVNINSETFGVIKLLNQLGFGEEVLYFISQDVIFDYVQEIQRLKGLMGEYTSNVEDVAYENIKKKYTATVGEDEFSKYSEPSLQTLKDLVLYKNKEDGTPDYPSNYDKYQVALLDKFRNMGQYVTELSELQRGMNVDSRGFGKSIIESNLKEEQIMGLFESNIKNATNLFGDVIKYEAGVNLEEKLADGYVQKYYNGITYLIKPTTIPGMAVVYGLFTNNELWNQVFPTNSVAVKAAFAEITDISGAEDKSFQNKSDLRFDIWNSIKSYMYTTGNDIFNGDVNSRRETLTKDVSHTEEITETTVENGVTTTKIVGTKLVYDNKSLATIVNDLKAHKLLKNNSFIQRLAFRKDGKNSNSPAIIEYNASKKEGVDETQLFIDFLDLFVGNNSLGVFNGEEYTTRKLAQELVEYSYITGGIQEATQFLKMIPPAYLKEIGFIDEMSNLSFYDARMLGIENNDEALPFEKISPWALQFIQHNPNVIKQRLTPTLVNTRGFLTEVVGNISEPKSFKINTDIAGRELMRVYKGFKDATLPTFLTYYSNNKTLLYKFNGERYEQISTLGTFGSSEYSWGTTNQVSIFDKPSTTTEIGKETPLQTVKNIPNSNKITAFDKLGVESTTDGKEQLKTILTNISVQQGFIGTLADLYLSAVDSLPDFKIEVVDTDEFFGRWGKGVLKLNSKALSKNSETGIRNKLMHEIAHVFTVEVLNSVLDSNNNIDAKKLDAIKDPQVKRAINSLSASLNQYKRYLIANDNANYLEAKSKIDNKESLTEEQVNKYYATKNIKEFVAQAMSDPKFQEILNNIPNAEISLYQKFKNAVVKLLNAFLGIKKGNLLEATIANTIDLINIEEVSLEEELSNETSFFEMKGINRIETSAKNIYKSGIVIIDNISPELYEILIHGQPQGKLRDLKEQFLEKALTLKINLLDVIDISLLENTKEYNELQKYLSGKLSNETLPSSEELGNIFNEPIMGGDTTKQAIRLVNQAFKNGKTTINKEWDLFYNKSNNTYSIDGGDNGTMVEDIGKSEAIEWVKMYLPKADKIEGVREEWFDSVDSNKYHFIIQDGTNKILAGEYKQGGGEWKAMNPKNWEHKRGMLLAGQVFGSATVITKEQANAEPSLEKNTIEPLLSQPENKEINNVFTFNDGIKIDTGNIVITDDQAIALNMVVDAINNKKDRFVLRGYAGVGKSTVAKFIQKYVEEKYRYGKRVGYAAPLHKATVNLYLFLLRGKITAKPTTLAKLLNMRKVDGVFQAGVNHKVPSNGVLIIDEASMIKAFDYDMLMRVAKSVGTTVIFMGDPAQLPPITSSFDKDYGKISKAMIFTKGEDGYELTKIMRQKDSNPILKILTSIRENLSTIKEQFTFKTNVNDDGEGVIFTNQYDEFKAKMDETFNSDSYSKDPTKAKIVAYTNMAIYNYNQYIRNLLGKTEPFMKGSILMGYEQSSSDPLVHNGQDYIITDSIYTTSKTPIFDGALPNGVKVITSNELSGFALTIKRVMSPEDTEILQKEAPELLRDLEIFIINPLDRKNINTLKDILEIKKFAEDNKFTWRERAYYSDLVDNFFKQNQLPVDLIMFRGELTTLPLLKQDSPELFKKDSNGSTQFEKESNKATLPKNIDYGYAVTAHKAQGSTYETVFVDYENMDNPMNNKEIKDDNGLYGNERNMLRYVGMSRTSKLDVVYSKKSEDTPIPTTPQIDNSDPTMYDLMPLGYPDTNRIEELKKICK